MNIAAWRRTFLLCGALLGLSIQSHAYAQSSPDDTCRNEIDEAERADKTGPLAVYQPEDETILIEIKKDDLEKEFIFANYVDRGVAPYVGQYAEPRLITFRLNGKKIDIIEKDSVGFFKNGGALSRTQALTMSDSVVGSLDLHECRPANSYFAQIDQSILTTLSSEFLDGFYGGSQMAAELKDWRTFSDNISFISEHRMSGSPDPYSDSSGTNFSIRIRHILLQRPEGNFKSRREDSRVGYFTVSRRDLGDINQLRPDAYIHRWRLEKKNPDADLSEPVKPIVFWIENTTPEKFRPYIRQGVLAWNEAFRAAGFLNAVEVYEQPADAGWEAGDISKNVIRWQSSYHARSNFGVAPAIHDPITGEILGADILMNYAGIGDYVDDWARLSGKESFTQPGDAARLRAQQRGVQLSQPAPNKISNNTLLNIEAPVSHLEDAYILASLVENSQKLSKKRAYAPSVEKIQSPTTAPDRMENTLVSETHGASGGAAAEELGFAERMVKEVIIQLTMHEVGHTLGLSHNFRGSRWRSMDEIFDSEKTMGAISASVMDYIPINFSPIGVEQGDFANTRLGPYDIWAIEFGYRSDLDEAKRNDLLKRAVKPENAFSVRIFGNDPQTLLNDLTNAPIEYAKTRIEFASEATRLASRNDAFKERNQYLSLFQELSGQIILAVHAISTQSAPFTSDVAQVGDEPSDLYQTVTARSKAEQKEAIKALGDLVFSADALPFAEEFVFRLGDRFYAAETLRVNAKRTAMFELMNERLLILRHRAGEYGVAYSSTELLFDLKHAVFGFDLNPLGRPGKNRRDQQIMFANYLAELINDGSDMYDDHYGREGYHRSIVSAHARPVRNALLRDLMIPTPWAPKEVRAHRQELRAILK